MESLSVPHSRLPSLCTALPQVRFSFEYNGGGTRHAHLDGVFWLPLSLLPLQGSGLQPATNARLIDSELHLVSVWVAGAAAAGHGGYGLSWP